MPIAMYGYMMEYLMHENSRHAKLALACVGEILLYNNNMNSINILIAGGLVINYLILVNDFNFQFAI